MDDALPQPSVLGNVFSVNTIEPFEQQLVTGGQKYLELFWILSGKEPTPDNGHNIRWQTTPSRLIIRGQRRSAESSSKWDILTTDVPNEQSSLTPPV